MRSARPRRGRDGRAPLSDAPVEPSAEASTTRAHRRHETPPAPPCLPPRRTKLKALIDERSAVERRTKEMAGQLEAQEKEARTLAALESPARRPLFHSRPLPCVPSTPRPDFPA